MIWQQFQSLQLPHTPPAPARRRYSVTADILAYQQCSLQYGAFVARKYEPALVVQLFYGTIMLGSLMSSMMFSAAHRPNSDIGWCTVLMPSTSIIG